MLIYQIWSNFNTSVIIGGAKENMGGGGQISHAPGGTTTVYLQELNIADPAFAFSNIRQFLTIYNYIRRYKGRGLKGNLCFRGLKAF